MTKRRRARHRGIKSIDPFCPDKKRRPDNNSSEGILTSRPGKKPRYANKAPKKRRGSKDYGNDFELSDLDAVRNLSDSDDDKINRQHRALDDKQQRQQQKPQHREKSAPPRFPRPPHSRPRSPRPTAAMDDDRESADMVIDGRQRRIESAARWHGPPSLERALNDDARHMESEDTKRYGGDGGSTSKIFGHERHGLPPHARRRAARRHDEGEEKVKLLEQIPFGEVAQGPPEFDVLPKKSRSKNMPATTARRRMNQLPSPAAAAAAAAKRDALRDPSARGDSASALAAQQAQQLRGALRERMISAYKELKRRRQDF